MNGSNKPDNEPLNALPDIISGPIIRRATPQKLVIWLATSKAFNFSFELFQTSQGERLSTLELNKEHCEIFQLGVHAFITLLEIPLPGDATHFCYDLHLSTKDKTADSKEDKYLSELCPHLLYPFEDRFTVCIKEKIDKFYHGSCRKPHHPSADALIQVDKQLAATDGNYADTPAFLLMSGDQVYTDDVSGPMLNAIQQLIPRLGLFEEPLPSEHIQHSSELTVSPYNYYQRCELLPHVDAERGWLDAFIGPSKMPIFSSRSANKHLISFAEMSAMYLLTWSDALWRLVDWNTVEATTESLGDSYRNEYLFELEVIKEFQQGLSNVARLLAHLPTYMIFDDHDITDDWNLTRGWEEAAYNNAFSKRIIGNSLITYFLFQGWGNCPEKFDLEFKTKVHHGLKELKLSQQTSPTSKQDALIDFLLQFDQWHFTLDCHPKLVVLDTRTHRWRSERSLTRPSGLMDWEALSDMQQELIGEDAVMMVSAAPIFGIKFIEVVQRFFTFIGQALMVDAENWMAHPGSASVILNIFLHKKTPRNFVILSGDVHYSFTFNVRIRRRKESPYIWQITASGIKNQFPDKLLKVFDFFDRWLYTSRSPLNFFTKRRRMRIMARKINGDRNRRILNQSGIGYLELDSKGKPTNIQLLTAKGETENFL